MGKAKKTMNAFRCCGINKEEEFFRQSEFLSAVYCYEKSLKLLKSNYRFEKALSWAILAVEKDPSNDVFPFHLAQILILLKKFKDAEIYLRKAIALITDNEKIKYEYYGYLGYVQYKLGDEEHALQNCLVGNVHSVPISKLTSSLKDARVAFGIIRGLIFNAQEDPSSAEMEFSSSYRLSTSHPFGIFPSSKYMKLEKKHLHLPNPLSFHSIHPEFVPSELTADRYILSSILKE
jgi:tetratricopeptide (TPR) repeat protein